MFHVDGSSSSTGFQISATHAPSGITIEAQTSGYIPFGVRYQDESLILITWALLTVMFWTAFWHLLAGLGTYLFRVSFIAFAGRFETIPRRAETMLTMIPPAVLAAIAAESLLYDGDSLRGFDEWHVAIAVAAVVSLKTKSVALCLAVGMPVVWGLAALG